MLESLSLNFTNQEIEYVSLVMYKASRDTERLPMHELTKLIKELQKEAEKILPEINEESASHPQILSSGESARQPSETENIQKVKDEPKIVDEEIVEEKQEIKESEKESIPENPIKEEADKNKLPVSQSVPQEISNNPLEPAIKEFSEEEIVQTAQKVLSDIAQKVHETGLTPAKIFGEFLTKQQTDEGEKEFIASSDFLKKIEEIGVKNLSPKSAQCMLKVLSATEDEKYILLSDFEQVMEDYNAAQQPKMSEDEQKVEKPEEEKPEEEPENHKKESKFPMKIDTLDKISMVILLALAEYLQKENLTVEGLFGEKCYKQMVKTKSKQKTIDILNSKDFFGILHEIGINTEEEEPENLKMYLALDTNYSDKIHVHKLEKVINKFTNDEAVRDYARECYKELVGDDEVMSGENVKSDEAPKSEKIEDDFEDNEEIQEN